MYNFLQIYIVFLQQKCHQNKLQVYEQYEERSNTIQYYNKVKSHVFYDQLSQQKKQKSI